MFDSSSNKPQEVENKKNKLEHFFLPKEKRDVYETFPQTIGTIEEWKDFIVVINNLNETGNLIKGGKPKIEKQKFVKLEKPEIEGTEKTEIEGVENIEKPEIEGTKNIEKPKIEKKWIYRGQSNSFKEGLFTKWDLESPLRRLVSSTFPEKKWINSYVFEIMQEEYKKDNTKGIIETWSRLGYLGVETPFINFTDDIYQALWYGFKSKKFSSKNKGYVSLFLKEIDVKKIKKEIKTNFNYNEFCKFKEPIKCSKEIDINNPSDLYFIIDGHKTKQCLFEESFEEIRIEYSLKNEIISYCEDKFKNVEQPIFKDQLKDDGYFLKNSFMRLIEGNSFFRKGEYLSAIKEFQSSTEINENNIYAYQNWGMCLSILGLHKDATKKFMKVIEMDPNHSNAHYFLGKNLIKLNDFIGALESFEKVNKITNNKELLKKIWKIIRDDDFFKKTELFKNVRAKQLLLEIPKLK